MISPLIDDLKATLQAIQDSKAKDHRTIICPPELEERTKQIVHDFWAGGFFDVMVSEFVPTNTVYIAYTHMLNPCSEVLTPKLYPR